MFNLDEKYKHKDHFLMNSDSDLEKVCNAPEDKEGIYLVHQLSNGSIDLVYIGFSHNSGIKNEIVYGLHYNGQSRKVSWPLQLKNQQIDALDIYWFVTIDDTHRDKPIEVWKHVLNEYNSIYGRFPRWNRM